MSGDKIWANPVLGTETFFHFDEGEGEIILETRQNVDAIIEANKAAMNNVSNRRFGDGKLVAQIPILVLMQLAQCGVLSPQFAVLDEKRFSEFLNDNDNQDLRTWPGKI